MWDLRDQGSNLSLLHWQADSLPLRHQGSPYTQYFIIIYKGKEPEKNTYMLIHVCIAESLCYMPETNTTL